MFFFALYMQLTEDEAKVKRKGRMLDQILHLAETLNICIDHVRCVEDDNREDPDKLKEETLEKLLRQLQIMFDVSKDCTETLRKLDSEAFHKKE